MNHIIFSLTRFSIADSRGLHRRVSDRHERRPEEAEGAVPKAVRGVRGVDIAGPDSGRLRWRGEGVFHVRKLSVGGFDWTSKFCSRSGKFCYLDYLVDSHMLSFN